MGLQERYVGSAKRWSPMHSEPYSGTVDFGPGSVAIRAIAPNCICMRVIQVI